MHIGSYLLPAILGLALISVGCSSTSGEPTAETPEGACDAYAATYCSNAQQCSPYFSGTYTSLAQCTSHRAASCKAESGLPGSGVTPTFLNGCRAAIAAAACDGSTGSACLAPRGSRTPGQPCAEDTQCTSASCNGEGDLKCGTCRPGAELGQACSNATPCIPGLHCKGTQTGSGGSSSGATCVARLKAGSACGPDDKCESPNSCRDGVCSPLPGKGQACTGSCASGLTCSTTSGTAGTCVVTEVKIAQPGQPCDIVSGVSCAGGGECKSSVCTAPLELGSTCSASTGSAGTTGSSYPDGSCGGVAKCVNGTCQIPPYPTCN